MKPDIKLLLLTILSVILLVLTLPPWNISFFAWISFIPLLFSIIEVKRYSFIMLICTSALIGAIASYFALNWVIAYQKGIFFIVWFLCMMIFPIFSISTYFLLKIVKNIFLQSLLIPSVWIILMKLYSLSYVGYQWGEQFLAYAQSNLYIIQMVSIFGTTGLTYLILFNNVSFSLLLIHRNLNSLKVVIFNLLLISCALFYGFNEIKKINHKEASIIQGKETIRIALVQPGISGEPGFERTTPNLSYHDILIPCIRRKYKLSQFVSISKLAEEKKSDLIIWPQYNLPIDITKSPEMIKRIYSDFNTPILMGTFIYKEEKIANISLLINQKGEVADIRMSVKPPPFRRMNQTFGEGFMPLKFQNDNSDKSCRIGALLCYEDTSAEGAIEMVKNGAQVLLVHANNEVFQKTCLPMMHFRRDIFRAIENRRFIIRAATTGISAIIDTKGQVVQKIDLGKKFLSFAQIPLFSNSTFFTKYGNCTWLFSLMCLILSLSISQFNRIRIISKEEK